MRILFWKTGCEGEYDIEINESDKISGGNDPFAGSIKVTNEELYFVNYESIAMAASYEDECLPEKHLHGYAIKLPNGIYHVKISKKGRKYRIEYCKAEESKEPWTIIPEIM
jgi:hypothetical protein